MRITMETMDRLAELSMLSFTQQEKVQLRDELEDMLQLIDPLNEVDTAGIDPLIHMSEEQELREDSVAGHIERGVAMINSKNHDDLFFRTPPALKR